MTVWESELDDYLETAAALFDGRLAEVELPPAAANLPTINQKRVEQLAAMAAVAAFTQPKYGWALTAVAAAAAAHNEDIFLQALAAWYLARAANAWVQPERVDTAVARARAGFSELDEQGWLAACAWQQNAEPWLRNDFHQAVADLQQASITLEQHGMVDFSWQCRLSLAYGHILVGQFELAEKHIDLCEQTFSRQEGDTSNLVLCYLHRSSLLRRQMHFVAAKTSLHKALRLLENNNSPIFLAKINFQLAYCEFLHSSDHRATEHLFLEAAVQFATCEIELWHAFCLKGLVQLFNNTGRLTEADKLLTHLETIYERYEVLGLQADNAIECGGQALFRGRWRTAVTFFQQAKSKYKRLKIPYMAAMATLYLGDAYAQAAKYLRALYAYEDALQQFELLQDEWRLAECNMHLSQICLDLRRPDMAAVYVKAAAKLFENVQQEEWLVNVALFQARIYIYQDHQVQAVKAFEWALEIAVQIGNPAQIAHVQRLFGEALCLFGATGGTEGEKLLRTATAAFAEMGMVIEEATCYVTLGNYYNKLKKQAAAQAAWEYALTLNHASIPDIAWRAKAGLGELFEYERQFDLALDQFQQAALILAQMRQDLWQPSLAGSYLLEPASMWDRAVTLAGKMGARQHIIVLIEAGKAHNIRRTSISVGLEMPQSAQLIELGAEIRWLQQQILADRVPDSMNVEQIRILNAQLVQKANAYDLLAGQVERSHFALQAENDDTNGSAEPNVPGVYFDVAHMREMANQTLQPKWIALNYYLTDRHIIGTALTPDDQFEWIHELTPAIQFALNLMTQKPHTREWSLRHLTALADWLLPAYMQAQLTPETYLLIAPHRQLHRLPWAAMLVGEPRRHLAEVAVPVMIPSWRTLLSLWQRPHPTNRSVQHGLVVSISNFNNRYAPLPQASHEVAALQNLYAENVTVLQDVTAAQLGEFVQKASLDRFDFLHIVSHAFVDEHTGRLSGLALRDRDLWLDEIPPLGPLPATVVLSACSSNVGRLFAGDEQMGLAMTCLESGAQRVVGSLWPVADKNMPRLMRAFYRYLRVGKPVAKALAQAQREMLAAKLPAEVWSGFTLVGAP